MNLRRIFFGIVLANVATGCAFFDEPVGNNSNFDTDQPPAVETESTQLPMGAPRSSAKKVPAPPTSGLQSQAVPHPAYLVVAPIGSFPLDAQNVAIVHLTDRNTRRELALCKALMQKMPTVEVQDLPATPLGILIWPVPNDNPGPNCIEMIASYEGIELTREAQQRIDNDARGPFLLTRNLASGSRMIFDTSFMADNALAATLSQWISLLGSNPADWPPYRRAR